MAKILKPGELGHGLLIEYDAGYIYPKDNQKFISEIKKLDNGGKIIEEPLVLYAVLQKCGVENRNGRIYPRDVLSREVEKYQQIIKERRALGELDHPDSSIINLKNVSHNVVECHWEGDTVVGKIELLTTPSGNIARELIKNNIRLGVSSRGMGSVRQMGEGTVEVQDDFSLVCFDIVSNPSTHGAFINENKSSQVITPYSRIDSLIYDFLSEVK